MDTQTKRRLIIDRITWLRQHPVTDFTNAWVSDLYNELETLDKGN